MSGALSTDPVHCGSDVNKAADLLAQGKRVSLDEVDDVGTLLDTLRARVQEAKKQGKKASNFDLCNVSVKGTNLFCAEHRGVARVQMPQLKGFPKKGSRADGLPRDKRGEVDVLGHFREHLGKNGIKSTDTSVRASHLKATQRELNGAKVAGIANAMESGTILEGRILVTRDNYIVDGHHRWAASVGVSSRNNRLGDLDVNVTRIDMSIGDALLEGNAFARHMGLPSQGFNSRMGSDDKLAEDGGCECGEEKHLPGRHDQSRHGRGGLPNLSTKGAEAALGKLKSNGGFTITPDGKPADTHGYMVSIEGAEKKISFESIAAKDILDYHKSQESTFAKDKSLTLGGWHDTETGTVYLDVSRKFDDIDEAKTFGRANRQKAIYDGIKDEVIELGDDSAKAETRFADLPVARQLDAWRTKFRNPVKGE